MWLCLDDLLTEVCLDNCAYMFVKIHVGAMRRSAAVALRNLSSINDNTCNMYNLS